MEVTMRDPVQLWHPNIRQSQRGFTLIETLIAMSVMVVGLVGVLGVFSTSVGSAYNSQADLIAKQKVRQALESIFTARNTAQVTFDMVNNASNGGVFLDGWQRLHTAGADGLIGTADDGVLDFVTLPGPDNLLGTADDVNVPLIQYQRKIEIQPAVRLDGSADPNLRRVTVSIHYPAANGVLSTYAVTTYISRYR